MAKIKDLEKNTTVRYPEGRIDLILLYIRQQGRIVRKVRNEDQVDDVLIFFLINPKTQEIIQLCGLTSPKKGIDHFSKNKDAKIIWEVLEPKNQAYTLHLPTESYWTWFAKRAERGSELAGYTVPQVLNEISNKMIECTVHENLENEYPEIQEYTRILSKFVVKNELEARSKPSLYIDNFRERVNSVLKQENEPWSLEKIKESLLVSKNKKQVLKNSDGSKMVVKQTTRQGIRDEEMRQIYEYGLALNMNSPRADFIFVFTAIVCFFAGLRIKEGAYMTEQNLNDIISTGSTTIVQTKTQEKREALYSDLAREWLKEYKNKGFFKKVFVPKASYPKNEGRTYIEENFQVVPTISNYIRDTTLIELVNERLKRLFHRSDLKSHSYRIGYIEKLRQDKISDHEISKMVGHKQLETTYRYFKRELTREEKSAILQRVFKNKKLSD